MAPTDTKIEIICAWGNDEEGKVQREALLEMIPDSFDQAPPPRKSAYTPQLDEHVFAEQLRVWAEDDTRIVHDEDGILSMVRRDADLDKPKVIQFLPSLRCLLDANAVDLIRHYYSDRSNRKYVNALLLSHLSDALRRWTDAAVRLSAAGIGSNRVVAVCRILKATVAAYRRGDDAFLGALERKARPYLREHSMDVVRDSVNAQGHLLDIWYLVLVDACEVDLANKDKRWAFAVSAAREFLLHTTDDDWNWWASEAIKDVERNGPAMTEANIHKVAAALDKRLDSFSSSRKLFFTNKELLEPILEKESRVLATSVLNALGIQTKDFLRGFDEAQKRARKP
jgi:hypothetical protein